MMKSLLKLMLAAGVLVTMACASTGSGRLSAMTWDLGTATAPDAQSIPLLEFERNLYRMERQVGPPNIMLQTAWRERPVFDDEQEAGFSTARTRFIMEARPRMRSAEGGSDLYTVQLRVENMGRLATGGEWMTMSPTPEFREYAGDIAAAIRANFENRTRIR